MRPNPEDEAGRWIKQAGHDLDAARDLEKTGQYNLTCFLSRQAAGKAVEALQYGQGALSVSGNSVKVLLESSLDRFPELSDLVPKGARLDRHYIPARYPDALLGGTPKGAYDDGDAREAIQLAEAVIDRIRELLGREPA